MNIFNLKQKILREKYTKVNENIIKIDKILADPSLINDWKIFYE